MSAFWSFLFPTKSKPELLKGYWERFNEQYTSLVTQRNNADPELIKTAEFTHSLAEIRIRGSPRFPSRHAGG